MLQYSLARKITVVSVLLLAFYYALPNILSEESRSNLPEWMNRETVNLGLDLQGGSHMVLQVDVNTVFKRAYENMEDEIRGILRDGEKEYGYRTLTALDDRVALVLNDYNMTGEVSKLLEEKMIGVSVAVEGASLVITFTDTQQQIMSNQAVGKTLEILRSRVDEFGVAEPLIQRQGADRIIIELPGIDDVERAKSIIGRTALLSFHLVDETRDAERYTSRRAPPGRVVMYEKVKDGTGTVMKVPYLLKKRASLTGYNLADASSGFNQNGENAVFIRFDSKGTRQFGELTTKHVGQRMAIVLDGEVYSAPSLREPILGGNASITGSFSSAEAQDLAMILRAGALPAPVKFAEERSVGPSLGVDSVEAGRNAIMIGFVIVMVLMVIFYKGFGLAANAALLFNVVLIIGFMTVIGATMTLPGMAGIVLTIGMAVDANVLIFERIREEFVKGKRTVSKAVEEGFANAYSTILDANITTLIAAIVLFAMGSGPIKGFALTLSVGIASSMFTAILVTRLLLTLWVQYKRPKTLKV
jgi:protein-export membrane protein SecD